MLNAANELWQQNEHRKRATCIKCVESGYRSVLHAKTDPLNMQVALARLMDDVPHAGAILHLASCSMYEFVHLVSCNLELRTFAISTPLKRNRKKR